MANPEREEARHPAIEEDELFLDQLKDSFCFFFAATVTMMELAKYLSAEKKEK